MLSVPPSAPGNEFGGRQRGVNVDRGLGPRHRRRDDLRCVLIQQPHTEILNRL